MRIVVALLCAAVAGCVAPPAYMTTDGSAERAARFTDLSMAQGLAPPSVTNVPAPNGVPVTVVVFDERNLFASGSATPNAGSGALFNVVAAAMRQDVPGAQLTLLGHTDAVGSDPVNDALSLRRAEAVLGALQRRAVDGGQLSTVAIGRRQPIAPNATEAGRARNRRVEFLVSSSGDANLDVIGARPVRRDWLAMGGGTRAAPSTSVAVMRPAAGSGPSDLSEAPLQKSRTLVLQPGS